MQQQQIIDRPERVALEGNTVLDEQIQVPTLTLSPPNPAANPFAAAALEDETRVLQRHATGAPRASSLPPPERPVSPEILAPRPPPAAADGRAPMEILAPRPPPAAADGRAPMDVSPEVTLPQPTRANSPGPASRAERNRILNRASLYGFLPRSEEDWELAP